MDGESSNKLSKNSKSIDAIITAINMAVMGAGIAAAAIAANKSKIASADASRIEKTVSELNSKFDKVSEQLKSIQPAKIEVPATTAKETEKKQDSGEQQQQQPKPQQDVIYVRKSSEFSFYN
jgi:protein-disulfide isomerase